MECEDESRHDVHRSIVVRHGAPKRVYGVVVHIMLKILKQSKRD